MHQLAIISGGTLGESGGYDVPFVDVITYGDPSFNVGIGIDIPVATHAHCMAHDSESGRLFSLGGVDTE